MQLEGFNSLGQRLTTNRQFPQLALADVSYAPGLRLANHAHERGKICLVVEGKYHERIGSQTIHYRPFHCVYHPPGFDHTEGVGDKGVRLLSLSFDRALFDEVDSRTRELTSLRDLTGCSQVWRILRLFTRSRRYYRSRPKPLQLASSRRSSPLLEKSHGFAGLSWRPGTSSSRTTDQT